MGETIHLNGKVIAVVGILILLLGGTFAMFALNKSSHNSTAGSSNSQTTNGNSKSEIPEKCRLPAGQDVNSWKEHLGHHAETQECLQYFK